MTGTPHTASELFELAALFRRSAENTDQDEIREKLRNAAAEIEARARLIADDFCAGGRGAQPVFAGRFSRLTL